MKVFTKKTLWILLAIYFAIWTTLVAVASSIAGDYKEYIDGFLGLDSYEFLEKETDEQTDTNYYKSAFVNSNGSLNTQALQDYSRELAERTQAEGTVLLWNEDAGGNVGLPLGEGKSVSCFLRGSGKGSNHYNGLVYSGTGSGSAISSGDIDSSAYDLPTVYSALTAAGLKVNKSLFDWYTSQVQGDYKGNGANTINEIPWDKVVAANSSSFGSFNDAAILIISRYGGENAEFLVGTADTIGKDPFELHENERRALEEVIKLKASGSFKKVIVLLNTPVGINFDLLKNYKNDINACVWIGQPGYVGLNAIGKIISGKDGVQAGGRLADTFAYLSQSHPSMANVEQEYTNASAYGLPSGVTIPEGSDYRASYVVYAEGIYVGYKYFETRYEDAVMGNGNAASSKGVLSSDYTSWVYGQEVAYPFGYSCGYTSFEYSDFIAERQEDDSYKITVKVKNVGEVSASEVVQAYIQKPYTEFDKTNKIEQASVNLCGYKRTKVLAPNETETVEITVASDAFKTYDAFVNKTYIKEAGDYYLTVSSDAHKAVNNILAKKGYTPESTSNVMDGAGYAFLAEKIVESETDAVTFSKSATGYAVTNRFDNTDWNIYSGSEDVKYLSRSDWEATYPEAVRLQLSDKLYEDLKPNGAFEETETKFPTYNKQSGLMLAAMKDLDYDDPMWNKMLDQLTISQYASLLHGFNGSTAIPALGKPKESVHDGPLGIRAKFKNVDGKSESYSITFPNAPNVAATFDDELVRLIGDAKGEILIHLGWHGLYGTGMNIHRTPYMGRTYEYYSEDGFLSGAMAQCETDGIQGNNLNGEEKGVIATLKHLILNENERRRYGIATWANEQTVRELYCAAFEPSVVKANAKSVMTSFNRIGAKWSGGDYNLMTEVLRNEWGFKGYTVSDGNRRDYMGARDAILAGNDFLLISDFAVEKEIEGYIKSSPTVANRARDSVHAILYTVANCTAINGLSANTEIISITNWWQGALTGVTIGLGVLTAIFLTMFVLCFVLGKPKVQAASVERAKAKFGRKVEKYGSVAVAKKVDKRNKLIVGLSVTLAIVIAITSVAIPVTLKLTATPKVFEQTELKIEMPEGKSFYAGDEFDATQLSVIGVHADGRMKAVRLGADSVVKYFDAAGNEIVLDDGKLKYGIVKMTVDHDGFHAETPFEVKPQKIVFEAERSIITAYNANGVRTASEVTASGGSYVYNLNGEEQGKASVSFRIIADKDAKAEMFVTLANPTTGVYNLKDMFVLKVNGEVAALEDSVYYKVGASEPFKWSTRFASTFDLKQGYNEIDFVKNIGGTNFDCIAISSEAVLTNAVKTLEAEDASVTTSAAYKTGEIASASNGKYLRDIGKQSATIEFEYQSDEATNATLYATFARSTKEGKLSDMINKITVNGTEYTVGQNYPEVIFPTGSSAGFSETRLADVTFKEGANKIIVSVPSGGDINFYNFDRLAVVVGEEPKPFVPDEPSTPDTPDEPTEPDKITIDPTTDNAYTIEAESGVIVADQYSKGTENKSLEATNNPSGDAFVYGIGARVATFTYKFDSASAGKAKLYLRMGSYGTTSDKTRALSRVFDTFTVNGAVYTVGTDIENYTFVGAGSGKFYEWNDVFIMEIDAIEGENTIVIHKPGYSDWINFDAVKLVTESETSGTDDPDEPVVPDTPDTPDTPDEPTEPDKITIDPTTDNAYTIEAESGEIVADQYQTGTENKSLEATNNPSGDAYVYGIGARVATFTYKFDSASAGKAKLYLRMGSYGTTSDKTRALSRVFDNFTVNGAVYTVGTDIENHTFVGAGSGKYYEWTDVFIMEIDVIEGENTIVIHKPGYSDWINFDAVKLVTEVSA